MYDSFYLVILPTTQCQLGPYFLSKKILRCLETRLSIFTFSKAHFAYITASCLISLLSGMSRICFLIVSILILYYKFELYEFWMKYGLIWELFRSYPIRYVFDSFISLVKFLRKLIFLKRKFRSEMLPSNILSYIKNKSCFEVFFYNKKFIKNNFDLYHKFLKD